MKKLSYVNMWTAKPSKGISITEPSKTMQGMERPLSEILARLEKGVPLAIGNGQTFDEDNEPRPMPKVRDLTDVDALKAEIAQLKKYITDEQEKRRSVPDPEQGKIMPE